MDGGKETLLAINAGHRLHVHAVGVLVLELARLFNVYHKIDWGNCYGWDGERKLAKRMVLLHKQSLHLEMGSGYCLLLTQINNTSSSSQMNTYLSTHPEYPQCRFKMVPSMLL